MTQTLRDGSVVLDPRLGRLKQKDPRNADWPIRPLLSSQQISRGPRSYTWRLPQAGFLDQGSEGACVGFAITHEMLAPPVKITGVDARFAREQIYWQAQRDDPWEGGSYPGATSYNEGTSVLAGAKAAHAAGYYAEYRWATNEADLALAVGYKGPCVLGVNWYEGMFKPDADGFLRVAGQLAGGHAILVNGLNLKGDYYLLSNSWGVDWGVNGTAKISRADVSRLLSEDGEAMVPVRRSRPSS